MQLCKLVMFVALLLALYLSAANDLFQSVPVMYEAHRLGHSSLLTL
jgi:hypothetical protein